MDSVPCLKAWAESLGGITYPLLSDFFPHGEVARAYGVLRAEGYTERAIFVIDKQGVIRYIDIHDISQQPDNDELFRVLAEIEPHAAPMERAVEPPAAPTAGAVVMYCTSWCPDCRRAREYLKARGIQYVEVDIGRDRAAAAQVRQWANGNETTPTFNVKGTVIVGFDQPQLNRALGIG